MAYTYVLSVVLRVLQSVLTLLCIGLSSALPTQQVFGGSPTRVNYAIFASCFALVSLLYLAPATIIPRLFSKIYHPLIALVLDIINFVFFLAAGIALTAQLGVHSCSNQYYLSTNGITNGGGYFDQEKRCREAQALCAFFWFGMVVWLVSALVEVYRYLNEQTPYVAYTGRRRPSRVMV